MHENTLYTIAMVDKNTSEPVVQVTPLPDGTYLIEIGQDEEVLTRFIVTRQFGIYLGQMLTSILLTRKTESLVSLQAVQ